MRICAYIITCLITLICLTRSDLFGQDRPGYILEKEDEIGVKDSIHFGNGMAIGYNFFGSVEDFKYIFRKRVLKKGSEIRYHLQEKDEVYYILNGSGEMKMNDETFIVEKGVAILTRSGSWHGLRQQGINDLELLIVYEKE